MKENDIIFDKNSGKANDEHIEFKSCLGSEDADFDEWVYKSCIKAAQIISSLENKNAIGENSN